MSRLALSCWIAAILVTAFAAFRVSEDTQRMEADAEKVKRQVVQELEAIHVLKAEWSHLNQPARIAELAERHLELAPLDAARMKTFETLTVEEPDPMLGLVSAEPAAGAQQ